MTRQTKQPVQHSCGDDDEVDLKTIYETLLEVKETLDTHMAEENVYKPKVIELVNILDQSKGIIWFLKILSVVAVAGWGLVYWIRDHIRL